MTAPVKPDYTNLGVAMCGGWCITIDAGNGSVPILFSREQAFEIAKRIVEHFKDCPTPIAQAFKEVDLLLNDEHWKQK